MELRIPTHMREPATQRSSQPQAPATHRRVPLPHEDYYDAVDYEPTALLHEWRELRREYARLQGEGTADTAETHVRDSRNSPRNPSCSPKPLSPPVHTHAKKKLRSSLALDLHYAARERHSSHLFALNGSSVSSTPFDAASSSSSHASSSTVLSSDVVATETANAHRRYQSANSAYTLVSDPYDRCREIARQEQFMSESRRLGRPFVPAAPGNGAPTRLLLGDCVRGLYKRVLRDWPTAEPMVVSTAEDLIVVYFSLHDLKKRQTATVLAYMNAFAQRNETVREFRLCKVQEGWDVLTEDGHLMYTFRPPWVTKGRRFLPDTVHPATAHVS